MSESFAVKGNIVFTESMDAFSIYENHYIVVEGSTIKGIYPSIDPMIPVYDYENHLIIPGFVDLHVHAPQYANKGLGVDLELMPWLEKYTFPEEAKFSDLDYAKKIYTAFIKELWRNGSLRSCVFGTIHKEATSLLMALFHEAGLGAYVGKVNMDRNSPDFLIEETQQSLLDTKEWIEETLHKYPLVKPIITPRFIPTCSIELMKGLGDLAKDYQIPVQSHLDENLNEIAFVKSLHPEFKNYASGYNEQGLFGDTPTIMAHCVFVNEDEMDLMAEKQVFCAHSPLSNCNLSSGIAPIRRLLKKHIPVGLATDVSGGHSLSIMRVMINSAEMSNLKWIECQHEEEPLSFSELFYLATKGGGAFFGKVGSFEPGYEFDALIIQDQSFTELKPLTIEERLQKMIYTGDDRQIVLRFVAGKVLNEPFTL